MHPHVQAWLCATLAAMTMALNGYDSSTFNSIQAFGSFVAHFKKPQETAIEPNLLGAVNTAYTCGGIVTGFFLTPTLSKYLGRRLCIQIGCTVVVLSTFLQTFAPNIASFIAGRLILGMGQGIALPNGPVYIAEIAPANIRGMMMSFWQMWYAIGSFIVYWIVYGISKSTTNLGDWQYRIPILCQIVVPSIITAGMFWCPESPRWLVETGRVERARESLSRTRIPSDVEDELGAIVAAVNFEKAVVDSSHKWWTPYLTLLKEPSLRRRSLVALFINAGQQVTGSTVLQSYTTLVYKSVFSDTNTIFLINALYATFAIVFCLSCTWLVERLGRRSLLLIGAVGQGLAILIVAVVGITQPVDASGHRSYGVGVGIASLFFLFAFFYKPTWGATVWVYTADIFSTDVRAHAISMSAQTQSVVNTILNQFFPTFLANCGFYTFFFFAGMNAILFVGTWFFVPETKGVPLEDIDSLFGATSHRIAGEALPDDKVLSAHGVTQAQLAGIHDDHTEKAEVEHV